jgi:hypothetical protein
VAAILARFRRAFRRLFRGLFRARRGPDVDEVQFCSSRANLPSDFPPWRMIVVGSRKSPKWAIFPCPCGRGHRIELNLQLAHAPRWALTLDKGFPTLTPSIDYQAKVRCHFFLYRGFVSWVQD